MLHAGHHRVAIRRTLALHRLDHRPSHFGGQIGIFAEAFRGATPARIAGDVDHRRPGHVETVVGGFIRRNTPHRVNRIQVKGRGQTQAYREHGTLAVNHVIGEKQRDFQPAELHDLVLHRADIRTGHGIENCPDLAVFDHLADRLFRVIRPDADQP